MPLDIKELVEAFQTPLTHCEKSNLETIIRIEILHQLRINLKKKSSITLKIAQEELSKVAKKILENKEKNDKQKRGALDKKGNLVKEFPMQDTTTSPEAYKKVFDETLSEIKVFEETLSEINKQICSDIPSDKISFEKFATINSLNPCTYANRIAPALEQHLTVLFPLAAVLAGYFKAPKELGETFFKTDYKILTLLHAFYKQAIKGDNTTKAPSLLKSGTKYLLDTEKFAGWEERRGYPKGYEIYKYCKFVFELLIIYQNHPSVIKFVNKHDLFLICKAYDETIKGTKDKNNIDNFLIDPTNIGTPIGENIKDNITLSQLLESLRLPNAPAYVGAGDPVGADLPNKSEDITTTFAQDLNAIRLSFDNKSESGIFLEDAIINNMTVPVGPGVGTALPITTSFNSKKLTKKPSSGKENTPTEESIVGASNYDPAFLAFTNVSAGASAGAGAGGGAAGGAGAVPT